jgi:hypothetical protein
MIDTKSITQNVWYVMLGIFTTTPSVYHFFSISKTYMLPFWQKSYRIDLDNIVANIVTLIDKKESQVWFRIFIHIIQKVVMSCIKMIVDMMTSVL